MNSLKGIGKYLAPKLKTLDQPLLVSNFSKKITPVLIGGAAAYGVYNTFNAPKEKRDKQFIKNALVLSATVASALMAVKGFKLGKFKIPGLIHIRTPEREIYRSKRYISTFRKMLQKNSAIDSGTRQLFQDARLNQLLDKSAQKPLISKEVKELTELIGKNKWGKKLLNKLIPPPEDLSFKDIAGEIGRLSLLGAIPIIGGVTGGIAACAVNGHNIKEKAKPKIKEGIYQYLSNIVLCNVGAAGSLAVMEMPKVKNFIKSKNIDTKLARAGAMVIGIAAVGILAGSAAANFIGKKIINPLLGEKNNTESPVQNKLKNIYSERRPEFLDAILHLDDIPTVGVMSGFSWIEPALPLMYSISGYRAGMGYRNGNGHADRKGKIFGNNSKQYKKYKKFHFENSSRANFLMNTAKERKEYYQDFLTVKPKNFF